MKKSSVVKRSVAIAGHKTSISLEQTFWEGLLEIAADRQVPLSKLLSEIDANRRNANLSSHIRLFVLDHFRSKLDTIS